MRANSVRVLPLRPPNEETRTPDNTLVETRVFSLLDTRLQHLHWNSGIGICVGDVGIGKSTAARAFAARNDPCVLFVTVSPVSNDKGRSPVAAMQSVVAALEADLYGDAGVPSSSHAVLERRIGQLAGRLMDSGGVYTIVFDEAQHLSRAAINMLRFWNEPHQTLWPCRIGLAFIGNDEFNLKGGRESVVSEAVRNRAEGSGFVLELTKGDIAENDIELIAGAYGVSDREALAQIVEFYTRIMPGHLRHLSENVLPKCQILADGAPITLAIVRQVLFGR